MAYPTATITPEGHLLLANHNAASPAADLRTEPPDTVARLVKILGEHDGRLTIHDPTPRERATWKRAIFASRQARLVPDRMRIAHRGSTRGDLVVWLEAVPPESASAAATVTVPSQLRQPHPLVGAVKDVQSGPNGWVHTHGNAGMLHLRLHRNSRDRALRLVQGLIDECLRRGHSVKQISSRNCPGGIGVFIDGHGFEVAVGEESDRVPYEPTKAELAQAKRESWYRLPKHDYVPSGRLVLSTGHDGYSTTLANDR